MRTKFIAVMCLVLIMGFGSSLMAANPDDTGDACIATHDILESNVEIYNNGGIGPEMAKLYVKMAPGSTLPAMLVFDFDVDNNPATGIDQSLLNLPFTTTDCDGGSEPATSGPWHDPTGIDVYMVVALRIQSDTSSTAQCATCITAGNCTTRGDLCSSCTPSGTYYELGETCYPGDADCYKIVQSQKANCTEGVCYTLADACVATGSCQKGMYKGEWKAMVAPTEPASTRGDFFLPYLYSIKNNDEICITINWGKLVSRSGVAGGSVAAAPKYLVSGWLDPDNDTEPLGDKDDMFDLDTVNVHLVDFMPNDFNTFATGKYNANPECIANYDADRGVTSADLGGTGTPTNPVGFLDEWNKRNQFSFPCPACY